jgi:phage/plasmid-associated DNA primase
LGNNGKTTFLTIMRSLAGDYGTPVPDWLISA